MPEALLTEPFGPTHDVVSDFTLYKDSAGHEIRYPARYEVYRASAAIAKYAPVEFVAATTTAPLSVRKLTVAGAFAALIFAGVAQHAVAAGALVKICVTGVTLIQVDTSDPVFGDVAIKGAADGQVQTAGTVGGTWDAADVAGTGFGIFLDVEDSSDLAPIYLRPV